MIGKSESNQLSLATAPILGQAPSDRQLHAHKRHPLVVWRACQIALHTIRAGRGGSSRHN
ncbi:MAG: hypothetical protein GY792_37565 [Gammaproteobacteria bacterium]|nr:hypothetical protein [Gammaproteobacteria bacterium]